MVKDKIPYTIQYNTLQHSTIHYSTVQYNTVQYNTIHRYIDCIDYVTYAIKGTTKERLEGSEFLNCNAGQ